MKTRTTFIFSGVTALLLSCSQPQKSDYVPDSWKSGGAAKFYKTLPEDEKIWDLVTPSRRDIVAVTTKPHRVAWEGSPLCARPNMVKHSPHGEHWIHVFVSSNGWNTMVSGEGRFPEGTVILKQKFLDASASRTDFYTGMRKREAGYNSKAGDWEFFLLDKEADSVIGRGKIESCIDCHSKYRTTDFVSRRYLMEKDDTTIWGR